ncbi:MAG: collagen binding domain-containing protein, partial [Peptoniphilaceae bacterium]
MKRKLTALLLAMTFVFATVAPTMAASKQASASSNKTATVSVEKSKRRFRPLKAVVQLFSNKKEESVKSDDVAAKKVTQENSENKDNGGNDGSSDEKDKPKEEKKSGEKDEVKQEEETKVEPVEFTFSLIGESNEQLSGAAFTLKNVTNKDASELKDTWITDGNSRKLKLEPGKYQLKMTERPKGYKETSAEFEIEIVKSEKPGEPDKFNIVSKTLTFDKDAKKLTMKAEKEPEKEKEEIKTFFSLRDMAGKELSGAKLKIVKITEKDADKEAEELVKEWTSGNESVPYKLEKGKYKFVVVGLPDDCVVEKSSIDFEINEKGEIVVAEADKGRLEAKDGNQTLFMVAERLGDRIYFGLEDSYGKALSGLELKIEGNNGKVINLVSGERSIGVKVTDLPDGTYVFSQINVRYGHEAAEPIRFTVKDGKVVEASSGFTPLGKYQELTLVSKNISSSNSVKRVVTFSRVDSLGKFLLGTEIEIYKEGTKIASWKSGSDLHKLELEVGVYRYHEAAVVLGHKIAKDFEFEVKADGSIVLRGIQLGENVKLKEGGHICVGEAGGKLE